MGVKIKTALDQAHQVQFHPEILEEHKGQMTVVLKFFQNFESTLKNLRSDQIIVEGQISNILHRLEEGERFDCVAGNDIARTLKTLRMERRRLKAEIESLEMIQKTNVAPAQLSKACREAIGRLQDVEIYMGTSTKKKIEVPVG